MFHHGFWMHGHRRGQMFERGALKYLILDLISAKPRHGYDIIRELEESSGGCYSPSPGTIYPTLQMLEDLGHIVVKKENGKKVYEITDEGRAYLATHEDRVKQHQERMAKFFGPAGSREFASTVGEMRAIVHLVVPSVRRGAVGSDKVKAISEVLAKARKEIEDIIGK